MNKAILIAFILVYVVILSSCGFANYASSKRDDSGTHEQDFTSNGYNSDDSEADEFTITPTQYTFEDLEAMLIPSRIEDQKARNKDGKTRTETALENYNILLGHAESIIGKDYYLDGFFYIEYPSQINEDGILYSSYFIPVIPKEWFAEFEKNNIDMSPNLSIRADGKYKGVIGSALEPFLMGRKWTADLKTDFAKVFPDYHINTYYLTFDSISIDPARLVNKRFDDYTYFFNKSEHLTNTVNILLSPQTTLEEVESIFEEIEPLLKRYRVSKALLLIFTDEESAERVLSEELETDNSYNYDKENFSYGKWFYISQD